MFFCRYVRRFSVLFSDGFLVYGTGQKKRYKSPQPYILLFNVSITRVYIFS